MEYEGHSWDDVIRVFVPKGYVKIFYEEIKGENPGAYLMEIKYPYSDDTNYFWIPKSIIGGIDEEACFIWVYYKIYRNILRSTPAEYKELFTLYV